MLLVAKLGSELVVVETQSGVLEDVISPKLIDLSSITCHYKECRRDGKSVSKPFVTHQNYLDGLFDQLKGASINYVDKQGGEGFSQKSTILRKLI